MPFSPAAIAAVLRVLSPWVAKQTRLNKLANRKKCAMFAMVALAASEVFPEWNLVAKIIAGSCLTGNSLSLNFDPKGKEIL